MKLGVLDNRETRIPGLWMFLVVRCTVAVVRFGWAIFAVVMGVGLRPRVGREAAAYMDLELVCHLSNLGKQYTRQIPALGELRRE